MNHSVIQVFDQQTNENINSLNWNCWFSRDPPEIKKWYAVCGMCCSVIHWNFTSISLSTTDIDRSSTNHQHQLLTGIDMGLRSAGIMSLDTANSGVASRLRQAGGNFMELYGTVLLMHMVADKSSESDSEHRWGIAWYWYCKCWIYLDSPAESRVHDDHDVHGSTCCQKIDVKVFLYIFWQPTNYGNCSSLGWHDKKNPADLFCGSLFDRWRTWFLWWNLLICNTKV